MTQRAAKTGYGPTASVAVEQYFPEDQRIIQDDLAYQILPFGMRAFVQVMGIPIARDWMINAAEKSAPGIWGGLMCRKRYIDEKLLESLDQIEAVVNLGAGFDTRIYRFPALARVPVWEVDQPENIAPKQARLQNIFGAIPSHVQLVSIDFDKESLENKLTAQGYSLDEPTFFIWEAVTQYLTKEGVEATFAFLAKAAPGSRLAFTYVIQDFFKEDARLKSYERLYKQYVQKNIWLFGLDPGDVAPFLNKFGWRVVEHLGYEELAEQYVKPTGRDLPSMPIERMVYAEKV
jgi:methyltransferase (TIGR00027 family)